MGAVVGILINAVRPRRTAGIRQFRAPNADVRGESMADNGTVTLSLWMLPLLVLAGALVTGAALRLAAWRRGRALHALAAREGAEWRALCRVVRDGHFFDRGRGRRGAGPRATLVSINGALEYRPDRYEQRQGDLPMSWAIADIECLTMRQRRDITGTAMTEARLQFPQGTAVIAIFCETGAPPAWL